MSFFSIRKNLFIGASISLALTASAASSNNEIPWPILKKGIWAISQEINITGKQSMHIPESLTNGCHDPTAEMRAKEKLLEKDGCQIDLLSKMKEKITIAEACPNQQGNGDLMKSTVLLESKSSSDLKVTSISKDTKVIMTSRWVRECSTK